AFVGRGKLSGKRFDDGPSIDPDRGLRKPDARADEGGLANPGQVAGVARLQRNRTGGAIGWRPTAVGAGAIQTLLEQAGGAETARGVGRPRAAAERTPVLL